VAIPDEIRAGLDRGDLFVEYLPTVRLADARCVGGEALVRWRRGEDVLPASAFLPRIENTSLSGRLTYWVIETVAVELGDWLDAHREAHISISVPPEVVGRGGIEHAAARSGLRDRLGQIVFEISERGVPDRLGLETLDLAALCGLRVALADTTLSSVNLALLVRCNFCMIKLARELTAQLGPDKPLPGWIAGLQALYKSSALQVIAGGVETNYQAQWLYMAGVQMAQGPLFSPPLSTRGLKDLYAADRGAGKAVPLFLQGRRQP
jgi:sensor c-di-GMP phosphodiesterase-like protein